MPWTAAIIAGGAARRLNSLDKTSLLVGGRSILDRQLAVIRPLTDQVLVVANRPDPFRAAGLPVVADLVPGAGALGGIYTALVAATTDRVLALAGDMPFVTAAFLEHLVELSNGVDLVIPRSRDGFQPMCAVYSRTCLEPIRRRIDSHQLRVQDIASEVRVREVGPEALSAYDAGGVLFFNINTPGDHVRAQRIAAAREVQQP